eukprot:TRINITY_DN7500_c0_g1_i2.p6 TRINITY_DN7500_c0_g1~~TRINITY_DN7500_c0_g1_i2.p6  ORF type:complete len:134 (+),score=18.48 TRINITY_DN7500_c0_g1_i2:487-888(+)
MLENSVSEVEEVSGRFLQVAGLKYAHDPSLEAGSRIVGAILVIDGVEEAIDPCEFYNIANNNFLAGGGDAFEVFEQSETLLAVGPVLASAYQDYVAATSPISATTEGRIVSCLEDASNALCGGSFAPIRECEA